MNNLILHFSPAKKREKARLSLCYNPLTTFYSNLTSTFIHQNHPPITQPCAKCCSLIFQHQSVALSNISIESNQRAGSLSKHILSSQIYSFSQHFSKRVISANIWLCVRLGLKMQQLAAKGSVRLTTSHVKRHLQAG